MAAKYEELTGKVTEQPLPNTQLTPQLQESSTSVAKWDFPEWWKWDSIGAHVSWSEGAADMKNCQPGSKEKTLTEERELEVVREASLTSKGRATAQNRIGMPDIHG